VRVSELWTRTVSYIQYTVRHSAQWSQLRVRCVWSSDVVLWEFLTVVLSMRKSVLEAGVRGVCILCRCV
jgi:hypothetical protein